MGKIVRSVELEDTASPRRAQYALCLKQLSEGYVVEVSWGADSALPCCEMYYRPTLVEANRKFERIMANKTKARSKNVRTYRPVVSDCRKADIPVQEMLPYV